MRFWARSAEYLGAMEIVFVVYAADDYYTITCIRIRVLAGSVSRYTCDDVELAAPCFINIMRILTLLEFWTHSLCRYYYYITENSSNLAYLCFMWRDNTIVRTATYNTYYTNLWVCYQQTGDIHRLLDQSTLIQQLVNVSCLLWLQ